MEENLEKNSSNNSNHDKNQNQEIVNKLLETKTFTHKDAKVKFAKLEKRSHSNKKVSNNPKNASYGNRVQSKMSMKSIVTKNISSKHSDFEQRLNRISENLCNNLSNEKFSQLDDTKKKELEASLGWLFYTDSLKKKIREKIQLSMKNNDKIAIFLAMIGIIFNILASSAYLEIEKVWSKDDSKISINLIPNNSNYVVCLRTVTSLSTLILFIFLYRHYSIRLKYEIFKQKLEINSTMYSSGYLWMFLFEVLICSIHSPPFLNNIRVNINQTSGESNMVDLDIFFSSLIPLRFYLLFRYYSFYSTWADDRAEKICNECNTLGGISFAIKAELKERPYTVVSILMVLSILVFGYALRNLELSFTKDKVQTEFQDWSYVNNGFWCIIITILTVGYGDFYPQTIVGRMIAVVACLWGTFLISLMVVSLTISVEFTPQEQKAYDELKKGEIYSNLKTKALNLIRFAIKFKNFPDKREDIKDADMRLKYIRVYDQFKHSLNEFSLSRKFVLSREHEAGAENILYKLNENVGHEMENIIYISNKEITTLIDYLKLSQTIQEEIDNYIEKLDKMTEGLTKSLEACDIQASKNDKQENKEEDFYNDSEIENMHEEIVKMRRDNLIENGDIYCGSGPSQDYSPQENSSSNTREDQDLTNNNYNKTERNLNENTSQEPNYNNNSNNNSKQIYSKTSEKFQLAYKISESSEEENKNKSNEEEEEEQEKSDEDDSHDSSGDSSSISQSKSSKDSKSDSKSSYGSGNDVTNKSKSQNTSKSASSNN